MKSGRDNASLNRQNVSRQCLPRPNSDSFAVPVTKSTAYFSRSHHWQLLWQPKLATKSDNRWIPTRELPSEASFFFLFHGYFYLPPYRLISRAMSLLRSMLLFLLLSQATTLPERSTTLLQLFLVDVGLIMNLTGSDRRPGQVRKCSAIKSATIVTLAAF